MVPKCAGLLSLASSCVVVRTVAPDPRKRSQVYHRLVLGMACADISSSLCLALSTWPIPSSTGGVVWAVGTTASCAAQGYFTQFGISSPLYNASLSAYYLCAVRYSWKESRLKRIEPWFHAVPLGRALLTATAAASARVLNPAGLWCWIGTHPGRAESAATVNLYRWILFYGPLWIAIAVVTINLLLVYWKVRSVTLGTDIYTNPSRMFVSPRSSTNPTTNPTTNPAANPTTIPTNNNRQNVVNNNSTDDHNSIIRNNNNPVGDGNDGGNDHNNSNNENEGPSMDDGAVAGTEDSLAARTATATPPPPTRTDSNRRRRRVALYSSTSDGSSRSSFLHSVQRSMTFLPNPRADARRPPRGQAQQPRPRSSPLRRFGSATASSSATAPSASAARYAERRKRVVFHQCFRYALALYWTWIPLTLVRILQTLGRPPAYALFVLAALNTPIQGLPNFAIYLYPKVRETRRAAYAGKKGLWGWIQASVDAVAAVPVDNPNRRPSSAGGERFVDEDENINDAFDRQEQQQQGEGQQQRQQQEELLHESDGSDEGMDSAKHHSQPTGESMKNASSLKDEVMDEEAEENMTEI